MSTRNVLVLHFSDGRTIWWMTTTTYPTR